MPSIHIGCFVEQSHFQPRLTPNEGHGHGRQRQRTIGRRGGFAVSIHSNPQPTSGQHLHMVGQCHRRSTDGVKRKGGEHLIHLKQTNPFRAGMSDSFVAAGAGSARCLVGEPENTAAQKFRDAGIIPIGGGIVDHNDLVLRLHLPNHAPQRAEQQWKSVVDGNCHRHRGR